MKDWPTIEEGIEKVEWVKKNQIESLKRNTYKSIIYKTSDMVENQGRYAGYPKRTWNGDQFRGGYSDHFPVALIFKPNLTGNPLK